MNILKLNSVAPSEFQNKYAYLLHWRYILPLRKELHDNQPSWEAMYNHEIEKQLESDHIPYYILDEDSSLWVDWTETEKVNAIDCYIKYNSIADATDISLDEAKIFRRWFAQMIIDYSTITDFASEKDKQIYEVLDYWAKDMNSDVIKTLDLFYNSTVTYKATSGISCGCGTFTTSNAGTTYATSILGRSLNCNPLDEMKSKFIEVTASMFSDIDGFWLAYFSDIMLDNTVAYLEAILNYNLPLNFNRELAAISQLACSKAANAEIMQQEARKVIQDIITALKCLKDCTYTSQYNMVSRALANFGQIYPYLFWL